MAPLSHAGGGRSPGWRSPPGGRPWGIASSPSLCLARVSDAARRGSAQKGEVGTRGSHGEIDHLLNLLQVESPAVALVGRRGIVEPVTENDMTGSQCGADDLTHQLGPAGVHEEQFCFGRHALVLLAVFECVPDLLPDGCAARFAEAHHFMAQAPKASGQALDLCGFAAPLVSLESDGMPY